MKSEDFLFFLFLVFVLAEDFVFFLIFRVRFLGMSVQNHSENARKFSTFV